MYCDRWFDLQVVSGVWQVIWTFKNITVATTDCSRQSRWLGDNATCRSPKKTSKLSIYSTHTQLQRNCSTMPRDRWRQHTSIDRLGWLGRTHIPHARVLQLRLLRPSWSIQKHRMESTGNEQRKWVNQKRNWTNDSNEFFFQFVNGITISAPSSVCGKWRRH